MQDYFGQLMIFLLFFIPALIALVLFLLGRRRVTIVEFFMLLIVQGLVLGGTWWFGDQDTHGATMDHAVYNGRVREKRRVQVYCVHRYDCGCVEGEGCETCYRHPFDVDWNVYSTSGDVLALPT